ncbi:hypothetical protein TWF481_009836 [Arthrobotrys musiformis]|uniref:Apurinic-apyrimidinic endonuclease 1 n=1 Tax=Arthrobotrys musiformis TaxID=47236 RepID=A0AAV9W7I3_9PEZI
MAKRNRQAQSPPSDDDDSGFSQDSDGDPDFGNISQPATQSLSQDARARKPRGAAIASTAKRRAAADAEDDESESETIVKKTKRVRRSTIIGKLEDLDFKAEEQEEGEEDKISSSNTKTPRKSGGTVKVDTVSVKATKTVKTPAKAAKDTPKRQRKTKEEKAAEKAPMASRALKCAFRIGAHVSSAGGVENSVTNATIIGANSFALFLKSQRKWDSPPYKPTNISSFKKFTKAENYDSRKHMLPHGSYLVNLAQPDKEKAAKAYSSFVDDLKRAEALDIGLFNFHPGASLGEPRDEAIERIANSLNKAHEETSFVKTVLETMAGQGSVIGCKFEDLRDIIALVKDKSRVGVCIDTCHSFSAGYDLRSPEAYGAVMKEFDEVIGFKYLSALHLNDSKAPFNSHRDLHQNIGLGFLGLSAFRNVMNTKEFHDLPMVLETPLPDGDVSVWAKEIKLLESLVGLEADDPTFLALEKEYADKGAAERKAVLDKLGKKEAEKEEKEAKNKEKAKKKAAKEKLGDEKAKKRTPRKATATAKKRGKATKSVSESDSSELSEPESDFDSDASSCGGKH